MSTPAPDPGTPPGPTPLRLGLLVAVVGGMLDAYTFLTRDGVFASTQSGNVVLLAVRLVEGHPGRALSHLVPVLVFVLVAALTDVVLDSPRLRPRHVRGTVLVLEAVLLAVAGLVPATAPDAVVTVLVSAVAAVQTTVFRALAVGPFATIMTTGNLRSAGGALALAAVHRDGAQLHRARVYGSVVAAFAGGALLGGALAALWGSRSIWVASVVVLGAWASGAARGHRTGPQPRV